MFLYVFVSVFKMNSEDSLDQQQATNPARRRQGRYAGESDHPQRRKLPIPGIPNFRDNPRSFTCQQFTAGLKCCTCWPFTGLSSAPCAEEGWLDDEQVLSSSSHPSSAQDSFNTLCSSKCCETDWPSRKSSLVQRCAELFEPLCFSVHFHSVTLGA